MKNFSYSVVLLASCLLMACDNDQKKRSETSVSNLRVYVDSVKTVNPDYNNDAYWTSVESGYEERRHQAEENIAQADEKTRADYEALKADYENLKKSYLEEKEKARAANDYRVKIRNSLYGEGVIGEDMNFSFMTAENAVATYEHFVNTVYDNREAYSREDWDEIKLLYEAMDTRKNEIEKQISAKENLKIAAAKIKFSAIKSINRPLSKIEENSDAKDKDPARK